ncbi:hypothetical protein GCM10020218_065300 [Dactylosporangium vinaceum]
MWIDIFHTVVMRRDQQSDPPRRTAASEFHVACASSSTTNRHDHYDPGDKQRNPAAATGRRCVIESARSRTAAQDVDERQHTTLKNSGAATKTERRPRP